MKEKEKFPPKELNEIVASNFIRHRIQSNGYRMLKELSENFKECHRNYKELSRTYINMKKDTETMNKSQLAMKDTTSEIKNSLEGIISRLDESEE